MNTCDKCGSTIENEVVEYRADAPMPVDEMVKRIANDSPWITKFSPSGVGSHFCKYCFISRLFYCESELEHKNDCLWKQSLFHLKSAPEQHVIGFVKISKGLYYCEDCEKIHDSKCEKLYE